MGVKAQPVTGIAAQLAAFAHDLRHEDVPAEVRERALYSILDAVGAALAAGQFEFARRAASAVASLSAPGQVPVIGLPLRLQTRDAAFLNGILIHGLDYDDTHLQSAVHPTASLLPTILSVGYEQASSGPQMLSAYVAGVEAVARLGMFGGVQLREAGLHTTSVIGIFGCALAAGKLLGLTPSGLAMAQGIALSMASGVVGSPADGASNKRLHPGWASQSAITAAVLAKAGIEGPSRPYEGERGLFRSLEGQGGGVSAGLSARIADLGSVWESANISIKPLPACHFTHACSDAAVRLRRDHDFEIGDIKRVTALVPEGVVKAVCEPLELKRRPAGSYAAQFSIPYVVAASLIRGGFGLAELDDEAIADPSIRALAQLVDYEIDEQTTYPVHRTGEVHVELRDGTILRRREAINRGAPDRPLSLKEIEAKFRVNAALSATQVCPDAMMRAVMALNEQADGRSIIDSLCGASPPDQREC